MSSDEAKPFVAAAATAETTPAKGAPEGIAADESQRRALNVNAKSFVPKLDDSGSSPQKPAAAASAGSKPDASGSAATDANSKARQQQQQQQQQRTPVKGGNGASGKGNTGAGGTTSSTPNKQSRGAQQQQQQQQQPSMPPLPPPAGVPLGMLQGGGGLSPLTPNMLALQMQQNFLAMTSPMMFAAAAAAAAASPMAMRPPMMAPVPGLTGVPGLGPLGALGMPPMMPPMAPPPQVPPSPGANVAAAAAAAVAANAAAAAAAAASMPVFVQPPSSPLSVNVGNATLNAIKNHVPPKFACILIVGAPGVGKTTVGRQLVQELNDDDLGWAFFSGSDFISAKKAAHETLRDVFEALDKRLDECVTKQKSATPIRGLVIDKNCRGTEEVYYLSALLHSKGLTLTAVVNFDVADDGVLLTRLGQGDDFREKIKYHRVILSRIQDATKPVGLWKTIDAAGERKGVVQTLRTMVLGCSAQPPVKQLHMNSYSDSTNQLVSDYKTYCSVLTTFLSLVKSTKPGQFPLNTTFSPLKEAHVVGRKAVLKPEDYVVRRKVDGTRYALVFDGSGLYLVPRHMRSVLQMPRESWLGIPLSNAGKFVLDGDLVRLTKERQREKFVVNDVLFWGDKDSSANTLMRADWTERQQRLEVNLCNETTAFFPKKVDCVVVHQVSQPLKQTLALLEVGDYASDGLVFTHKHSARDPPIVWRPPEAQTVDFRLGAQLPKEEGVSGRRWPLEVFDVKVAKYVRYNDEFLEVANPRLHLVEGAIVCCALDTSAGAGAGAGGAGGKHHSWVYQRSRSDVPTAFMKAAVDELLSECLIPKATFVRLLAQERLVDAAAAAALTSAAAAATAGAAGGDGAGAAGAATTTVAGGGSKSGAAGAANAATNPAAQGTSAVSLATRGAFGSALGSGDGNGSVGTAPGTAPSAATMLQHLRASTAAASSTPLSAASVITAAAAAVSSGAPRGRGSPNVHVDPGNAVAVLTSMLNEGVVHKGALRTAPDGSPQAAPRGTRAGAAVAAKKEAQAEVQRQVAQARAEAEAAGRVFDASAAQMVARRARRQLSIEAAANAAAKSSPPPRPTSSSNGSGPLTVTVGVPVPIPTAAAAPKPKPSAGAAPSAATPSAATAAPAAASAAPAARKTTPPPAASAAPTATVASAPATAGAGGKQQPSQPPPRAPKVEKAEKAEKTEKAEKAEKKPGAEPKDASKEQKSDDDGSESDGNGDDKPRRRRRGARGGANRAGKRRAAALAGEGGAAADGAPAAPAAAATASTAAPPVVAAAAVPASA